MAARRVVGAAGAKGSERMVLSMGMRSWVGGLCEMDERVHVDGGVGGLTLRCLTVWTPSWVAMEMVCWQRTATMRGWSLQWK